jgi:hypothetical protein
MFPIPENTDFLLADAERENLYLSLIEQINKDFNLANEGIDFPLSVSRRTKNSASRKNLQNDSVQIC